ncbi:MAG: hypothetical protein AAB289_08495, partial [Chloroflexota bacterium]
NLEQAAVLVQKLHSNMREAGRDPATFHMEGRLRLAGATNDEWAAMYNGWVRLGATHFLVDTRRGSLSTVDGHLRALRQFKDALPAIVAAAKE